MHTKKKDDEMKEQIQNIQSEMYGIERERARGVPTYAFFDERTNSTKEHEYTYFPLKCISICTNGENA